MILFTHQRFQSWHVRYFVAGRQNAQKLFESTPWYDSEWPTIFGNEIGQRIGNLFFSRWTNCTCGFFLCFERLQSLGQRALAVIQRTIVTVALVCHDIDFRFICWCRRTLNRRSVVVVHVAVIFWWFDRQNRNALIRFAVVRVFSFTNRFDRSRSNRSKCRRHLLWSHFRMHCFQVSKQVGGVTGIAQSGGTNFAYGFSFIVNFTAIVRDEPKVRPNFRTSVWKRHYTHDFDVGSGGMLSIRARVARWR